MEGRGRPWKAVEGVMEDRGRPWKASWKTMEGRGRLDALPLASCSAHMSSDGQTESDWCD